MDSKTAAVAAAVATTNDIMGQVPPEMPERLVFFLENPYYDYLLDIEFEVGPAKEVIQAHEVILLAADNCFVQFCEKRPQETARVVQLPDLDPDGFKMMIRFVYTNRIQTGNQDGDVPVPIVFAALNCAKAIGYKAFEETCVQFISSAISNRNCIHLYAKAKTAQMDVDDPELTKLIMKRIKDNVKDILEAPEFNEISEEELCLLLSCDDWFLDELSVFEAVKRWAMARMDVAAAASEENGISNGRALRNAMGKAFHSIRFPLLTRKQFDGLWSNHDGLFEDSEIVTIFEYINGHIRKRKRQPELFVTRHRGIGSVRFAESQSQADIVEILIDDDDDVGNDVLEGAEVATTQTQTASESQGENSEHGHAHGFRPETPSGNAENEDMGVEIKESPSKRMKLELLSLSMFVAQLDENRERTRFINAIDEQLKLTLPTKRLYMPKLKTFHLRLLPDMDFAHGAALLQFIKRRFLCLHKFFFFYLKNELLNMWGTTVSLKLAETQFEKNIDNVFSQGVSVCITVSGVTILKICPVTGALTMFGLSTKDAQMILDTCGSSSNNFVLRKLNISECKITSLENVRADNLEKIVFRRVDVPASQFTRLIKNCGKLNQLTCNDLGGENIDLYRDILRKNPYLEKMHLSTFKLSYKDKVVGHENIKELYLNRFDLMAGKRKILKHFPSIFPAVERLTLNVNKPQDVEFLFDILQMPSVNWIMVHGFTLKTHAGKYSEKSEKVRNFLKATFSEGFADSLEMSMFLLQRRQGENLQDENEQDEHDCAPLRVSQWEGINLANEDECQRYYDTDFEHSSYGEIFQDVETYRWFMTTAKNPPKSKM